MRILHVNKFLYRRGGAEAYMLELASMQRDQGHQVEFFGMSHPDNEPMTYQQHFPAHVEFEPAPPRTADRLRLAGRMLWSRQSRAGMERTVDAFRPDVVHLHNIYHQLSPAILAPLAARGIPAVMTLHDYKLACPTYQLRDSNERTGGPVLCTACLDGGLRQAVQRSCKDGSRAASSLAALEVGLHRWTGAYDPVGTFICPSTFLKDAMTRAGVYPERMRVLDNFTTVPAVYRSGPGDDIIFFGRLSREKGVDTLIEAFAIVSERLAPRRPVLHIAGDGPEREALQQQATSLNADIRFHGRLAKPELTALLLSSRASVVPSRWHENQPLSVLESLAAGVPVIATTLGGLPDLVSDGRTGLLVPADAPDRLADGLQHYLEQPESAQRHGLAARSEAERRFSPARHSGGILDVYESVKVRARPQRQLEVR